MPGVKKEIKNSFTPEQPGQINVAGEVFFLALPGDSRTDITARMYDDSIKGDIAFQLLFLGGEPKEKGGPLFTQKEQEDLRRIFRAVFGVGKKNQKGIRVPCEKRDRDLMLKSLIHRRQMLLQTILDYDQLGAQDVHAKYLRDHLAKLNALIEKDIPQSRADCSFTGVVDPNAAKPLPLNEERMMRLVEIFTFLLAQGKDPVVELQERLPFPSDILPRMAISDAPDIYEYEEKYGSEHDGKTPAYGETLLKLRKLLMGQQDLTATASSNPEIAAAFAEIEKGLKIPDSEITGKSYPQRRDQILKKFTEMNSDIANHLKSSSDTSANLAKANEQIKTLTADKEKCTKELAELRPQFETAQKRIAELEAQVKKIQGDLDRCLKEKEGLQKNIKELTERAANLETITNQLKDANAKIDELQKKTPSTSEEVTKRLADIQGQLEAAQKALADQKALSEAALADTQAALEKAKEDLEEQVNLRKENETQLENTRNALGESLQKIQDLEQAAKDGNDQLQALRLQLAAAKEGNDAQIQELQDQIAAAEKAQTDTETLLEAEKAKVKQHLDEIFDLNLENGTLKETIAKLEKDKVDLKTQIASLTTELSDKTTQLEALQKVVSSKTPDEAVKALNEQLKRLSTEKETVETQLQLQTNLVSDKQREIDRLSGEKDTIKNEKAALLTKNGTLEKEIDRLRKEIKRYDDNLQFQISKNYELQEHIRENETKIAELETKCSTASPEEIEKLKSEIEAFKTKNSSLVIDKKTLTAKVLRYESGLEQQKTIIEKYETLLRRINDILPAGLTKFPEDLNASDIETAISDLRNRLSLPLPTSSSAASSSSAAASIPLSGFGENDLKMSLCMLNFLYYTLKRVYIKFGQEVDLEFQPVYDTIEENFSKWPDLTASIIEIFTQYLEDGSPSIESSGLSRLKGKLSTEQLQAVSPFGKFMAELFFDDTDPRLNDGTPFLFLLAYTYKLLNTQENIRLLGELNCRIPDRMRASVAPLPLVEPEEEKELEELEEDNDEDESGTAAASSSSSGLLSRTSSVSSLSRSTKRCSELTPVGEPRNSNDRIRLITKYANRLSRFPFCLNVVGWTDYSKSDLLAKATENYINFIKNFPQEKQEKYRKSLQDLRLRIARDGTVTMLGGGTRKRKAKAGNRTKTYKQYN